MTHSYYKPYQFITFGWVLFGLTVPFVAIRVYVQTHFRRQPWREAFLVLSLLLYLAHNIARTISWRNGGAAAGYTDDTPQVRTILKVQVVTMIAYPASVYIAKYMLLFLYLDLTPRQAFPKTWRAVIVAWIMAIAGTLYACCYDLSICRPFKDLLTPGKQDCWMHEWYFVSSWSLHVTLEILVYAIPFVILRNLVRMGSIEPRDKRAAYWMIFVGSFNVACALFLGIFNVISLPSIASRIPNMALLSTMYVFVGPIWQCTTLQIVCLPQVRRLLRGLSAGTLEKQKQKRLSLARQRSSKVPNVAVVEVSDDCMQVSASLELGREGGEMRKASDGSGMTLTNTWSSQV